MKQATNLAPKWKTGKIDVTSDTTCKKYLRAPSNWSSSFLSMDNELKANFKVRLIISKASEHLPKEANALHNYENHKESIRCLIKWVLGNETNGTT